MKARHQVTISNTSQAPTCPFPVPLSNQKDSSMSPLYNNVQTRTMVTILPPSMNHPTPCLDSKVPIPIPMPPALVDWPADIGTIRGRWASNESSVGVALEPHVAAYDSREEEVSEDLKKWKGADCS